MTAIQEESMRLAIAELARHQLQPGQSLEIHVAERVVGMFEVKPTAVVLESWGDFLAEHGGGDDPAEVPSCCGRTVAILHERGGDLIALD